jgi:hypothetical protein
MTSYPVKIYDKPIVNIKTDDSNRDKE